MTGSATDDDLEAHVAAIAGEGGLAGPRRLSESISAMEGRRAQIIGRLRREHAASWDEIGQACGMTRQGATRRWSRKMHAASFDSGAEAYQRGRPPYPLSVVEWAVPRGARRVLDLGAGPGKFTKLLVDAHLDVVAVEPSAAMRDQLAAIVPQAAVFDGSAERPEPQRRELLASVEELLDAHPDLTGRETFDLPYVTRCTRARRNSRPATGRGGLTRLGDDGPVSFRGVSGRPGSPAGAGWPGPPAQRPDRRESGRRPPRCAPELRDRAG